MRNAAMAAPQFREVVTEDSLDVEGQQKAPDYTFRLGTLPKYYVEAKKCGINISADPAPAYQLRRYGFSAKLAPLHPDRLRGTGSLIMAITILTGILVLVTGFYAWVTFRMSRANDRVVRLMEEQLYASNRPYINVSVTSEPGSPIFMLKIKNTGKSGAEDLLLTLDKSFQQFGDLAKEKQFSSFNAFKNPIPVFLRMLNFCSLFPIVRRIWK